MGGDSAASLFFQNNFLNSSVSQTILKTCEQNLILHTLTEFHDGEVIQTKILTILSTPGDPKPLVTFPQKASIQITLHQRLQKRK